MKLDLKLGIENGKCKVVHILPSGKVVKLADEKLAGDSLTVDLPEGKNVIKLIGKKAYGSLKAEFGNSETARILAGEDGETAVE